MFRGVLYAAGGHCKETNLWGMKYWRTFVSLRPVQKWLDEEVSYTHKNIRVLGKELQLISITITPK